MWYLIDSHQYFEQRNDAPFFNAIVPVFLIGGLSFIATMSNAINISTSGSEESLLDVVSYMGEGWFMYSFLSSFIKWIVVAVILYGFIMWFGLVGIDMFTVLSLSGMGFTPLVFSYFIDAFISVHYSFFTSVVPGRVSIAPVSSGIFGVFPVVVSTLIYIVCVAWAVHIWIGGIHQIGGVTPRKSTLVSVAVGVGLLLEQVIVGVV